MVTIIERWPYYTVLNIILIVAKYTFLGIDFASNGAWDGHNKEGARLW